MQWEIRSDHSVLDYKCPWLFSAALGIVSSYPLKKKDQAGLLFKIKLGGIVECIDTTHIHKSPLAMNICLSIKRFPINVQLYTIETWTWLLSTSLHDGLIQPMMLTSETGKVNGLLLRDKDCMKIMNVATMPLPIGL